MRAIWKRLKSKTYWLGLAVLLLGALEQAQATGMIPSLFEGRVQGWVMIGVSVLIFLLREATKQPVAEK